MADTPEFFPCKHPRFRVYSRLLGGALTIASEHLASTEFAQLDLGDARLNNRTRMLMERFAADPAASIPAACGGWGKLGRANSIASLQTIKKRLLMTGVSKREILNLLACCRGQCSRTKHPFNRPVK